MNNIVYSVIILTIIIITIIAVFRKEHLKSQSFQGTLVYFKLDGCPACAAFDPVWRELQEYGVYQYVVIKPPVAMQYGITKFPTLRYYKQNPKDISPNSLFTEYLGSRNTRDIIQFMKRL